MVLTTYYSHTSYTISSFRTMIDYCYIEHVTYLRTLLTAAAITLQHHNLHGADLTDATTPNANIYWYYDCARIAQT